jgi:hypothetical protein
LGKPFVYIASPYTKGDVAINTRASMAAFDAIMNDGRAWPVTPLWSHFQHILFPRKCQDWIELDRAMLPLYDACVRIAAEYSPLDYKQHDSSGADGEVAAFESMGKPVFYSLDDLFVWLGGRDDEPA